jgi:Putative adhesin
MVTRGLVAALMGAGLLTLGACGWDIAREQFVNEAVVGQRITSVRLANDSGDVTIRSGQQTKVRREVHYDNDRPGATHQVDGEVLVIGSCPVRNCWISYDITVPAGTRVDGAIDSGSATLDGVGAVNLKSGSGDVTIRGVSGRVNLDAGSGSVKVVDVGDVVAVEAGSGSVTVDNARAAVTVRASSADVQAHGVAGPADIDNASGDVSVQLSTPNDVRVHAQSGDVSVAVPRDTYRVTALTGSGGVDSGVTDDPAGAHQLDLRTDSGDIAVRYS